MARWHSFDTVVDRSDGEAAVPQEAAERMIDQVERSKLDVAAEHTDGGALRVSSRSKDALVETQWLLRRHDQGLPLRFTNYT